MTAQLEDHKASANGDNDEDERPDEEAESHEHVGVVGHADGGEDTDGHDGHANTTVNLIFGVIEEEELSLVEEENGTCQVIGSDEDVPDHSAGAQREDEQTIIAPHDRYRCDQIAPRKRPMAESDVIKSLRSVKIVE